METNSFKYRSTKKAMATKSSNALSTSCQTYRDTNDAAQKNALAEKL